MERLCISCLAKHLQRFCSHRGECSIYACQPVCNNCGFCSDDCASEIMQILISSILNVFFRTLIDKFFIVRLIYEQLKELGME